MSRQTDIIETKWAVQTLDQSEFSLSDMILYHGLFTNLYRFALREGLV